MAKVKKVDVKMAQKAEIMEVVTRALVQAGYVVKDGKDYGFTQGTVIVEGSTSDVQIKPITPKTGITRYEIVEAEEVSE